MVTYGRHPFIRLVSTYKDKVIDHIKFQHWRTFINYDPTHPYQVKCPNMLTNTVSGFGPNIITICYIGPKTRCCDNSMTISFWQTPKWSSLLCTPARTFDLKMTVNSGLEFFIFKFTEPLQRFLLTCQANSAFQGQIFLHWAAVTLKGLVEFQNKKF